MEQGERSCEGSRRRREGGREKGGRGSIPMGKGRKAACHTGSSGRNRSEQHGLWNVTAPTGFPAPLLGNLGTGWLSVLFNKIRIKTTASPDGTAAKTFLRVLLRPY